MLARIRLITGFILFYYVSVHLLNHAFGIASLSAMDSARMILHAPWFNPVGLTLLYGALLIHIGLALYSLYRRRRWRMRIGEAAQLLLGLTIPPLLLGHIIGTRAMFSLFGTDVDYHTVLFSLWQSSPGSGFRQMVLLLAAWTHGCLGMYYWLRLKPWYPLWQPYLYAMALLIPTLSLVGYIAASKDILALASDPQWAAALYDKSGYPADDALLLLQRIQLWANGIFFALLLSALALRAARIHWEKRHGLVRLRYDDGRSIQFPPGRSILEASREAGIPHASVCGGRGRCSTCRVRITQGEEHLPPPSEQELKVLARVNAGSKVRLACQTQPNSGEVSLIRVLPPDQASASDGFARPGYRQGQELEIAILFADLRAFTELSEKKLPYDVVFLLNQYFHNMGAAIESAGGRVDKFIGDGIMALFGIENGPANGSRSALAAAQLMSERLADLNKALENDLETPLRIGIGIHTGPAIVGEMGYANAKSVTAIGDSVNTASRLESASKEFGAELIVSQAVLDHANSDLPGFEQQEIAIRGRIEPMRIRIIRNASELPR